MNYQKIYNQITKRAKNENRKKGGELYYEAHHILPLCLGGEGKFKDLSHPNIVLLTAKEHLLCHILLCEIYPNEPKLKQALWLMAIGKRKNQNNNCKVSSRVYERLKINQAELMSNRVISDEFRKIHSELRKGIKESQETRDKKSKALKNHPSFKTKEFAEKMRGKRKSFTVSEKWLEQRKKPRKFKSQKIAKIDPDKMIVVEVFESIREVYKIYKNIYNIINKPFKLYEGYYWSYIDKNNKIKSYDIK